MNDPVVIAILSFVGVAITTLGAWVGQRTAAKSQERAKQVESRAPEWSAFLDAVNEQNEQQKKWLSCQLEEQSKEIRGLRADVSRLELITEDLKMKYRAALTMIREFRRSHPNTDIRVPEAIVPDLDDK